MTLISEQLERVHVRIKNAAQAVERDPGHILLVAMSKTQPVASIRLAYAAGQSHFGENYLQEGLAKIQQCQDLALVWHFTGPVQSNKTALIAANFDWVQTIDRAKIAQRLNDQRPENLAPLNVCIQVNIDAEQTKSGVSPEQVAVLAEQIRQMPRLRLRGLMAIPAYSPDPVQRLQSFQAMAALFKQLLDAGYDIDTLSMCMSDDLEQAITAGSSMIRIGTAIFGARTRPKDTA